MPKTQEGIQLEPRVCPLCGQAPYSIVGRGYDYDYRSTFHEFEYRRCGCGVVFPDLQPIHGELHKIYRTGSIWLRMTLALSCSCCMSATRSTSLLSRV